ncbi:MAG: DNA polymerase III subunit delta' [Deferrisomatales bacterium]|nr:DNA polymerase III subunit delta' [Deferrisomatales bacterium]
MSFAEILGHDRPLKVLRRALATGRVPHAYLFWGPDGVGKEAVARGTAGVLLCRDPEALPRAAACGACAACRKAASASHADLHLLAPAGASIPIAEVRALQEALGYRSFEGGRKVVIIRDAFRLTREASNALLKTLEEPSDGTHLVLLAHHRNQLLPTLVSRCQSLRFDPIPEDAVRRLLEVGGVEPEAARRMAQGAGGAPGAVWGQEPEALAAVVDEVRQVWSGWESASAAERFGRAAQWSGARGELGRRLDALEHLLTQELRQAARRSEAAAGTAAALGGLAQVRNLVERNVNAELALGAFFLGALDRPWEEVL